MVNDPEPDAEVLDLRGLKCPLPALFAKRALLRASPGKLLDIVADDPLAAIDIPHMCLQESFDVVFSVRDGAIVRLRLSRPSAPAADVLPSDPAAR
jgi:tRNA 2-thiouridine synthesizing protein A